jgi:hypothetical protein
MVSAPIVTALMEITKTFLLDFALRFCDGAIEREARGNMERVVMIPTPTRVIGTVQQSGLTNVTNFFTFRRLDQPYSGPWTIETLVCAAQYHAHFVATLNPGDLPFTLKTTSDILYAVRTPLIMATKIQRAFRDWKNRPALSMNGITVSNDLEDIQAIYERDFELMTTIHERSRATKIALKKTIAKKNDRIRQLEAKLQDVEMLLFEAGRTQPHQYSSDDSDDE